MDFDDPDDAEEELAAGLTPSSAPSPYSAPKPLSSSAPDPTSSKRTTPKYRECLKNHAVAIGGHAVDGCGEFLPAGDDGTLDALRCAACNCHRNFHRKDPSDDPSSAAAAAAAYHHHSPFSPYYRTHPAGYLHHHHHQPAPITPSSHHRPLALPSTSGGGAQSRDDQEDAMAGSGGQGTSSKKRFRTKFTQEQKDKMLAFAERVGWRIQKHDEAAVQQFCDEVCVKRHVLKVWMHNNKHTLGKKP